MKEIGSVILVGAGPGDAGLMTLRGKQALETAEVVLYDRLVGNEILSLIPDTTIKVDVGKKSGRHAIPQHEINALLLRYAREGKRVVRLKGGDPYLFGRGAEEIEALAAETIPFTVVPGVTSAVAVPAYAGIPVSHRDFSSSVHIITAHRKSGEAPGIDYKSLVKLGGTLIFLMGLSTIDAVTAGLLDAGMGPSTPAALIENGTRPNQRKIVCTIAEIAERSKTEGFHPPSILVVGDVCSLSQTFDWFSQLPLKGVNVMVTRPKTESSLSCRLRQLGADVTDFPCIRTEPLPVADLIFNQLAEYEWIIFTSPAGAELFLDGLRSRNTDTRSLYGIKLAAIGPKTAASFSERGIHMDYVPEIYNARELAKGLPQAQGGDSAMRVLLFRAEDGGPELVSSLNARGFSVEDVAAYKTIRESSCSEEVRGMLDCGEMDFITFTSASTVQGFTESLPDLDCSQMTAVCIGEETAAEAQKCGFRIVISKQATIDSIIDSIIECVREERKK